ncbi:Protein of unknown function [Gryllus bimaculatus]|nr:Protein of unknown function [Gryllus bimaculatus]
MHQCLVPNSHVETPPSLPVPHSTKCDHQIDTLYVSIPQVFSSWQQRKDCCKKRLVTNFLPDKRTHISTALRSRDNHQETRTCPSSFCSYVKPTLATRYQPSRNCRNTFQHDVTQALLQLEASKEVRCS